MNKAAMSAFRKPAQAGFTLIELIVVIVILGILAATALPRFANLGGDARVASLNAAKGALSTTSAMVHGQSLMQPNLQTITNENIAVTISNGYPNGTANTAIAAGLTDADYTVLTSVPSGGAANTPTIPTNGFVVIPNSVANSTRATTCFISYTPATATAAPVISAVPSSANCQ